MNVQDKKDLIASVREIIEERRKRILNNPDDPSYSEHFAELSNEISYFLEASLVVPKEIPVQLKWLQDKLSGLLSSMFAEIVFDLGLGSKIPHSASPYVKSEHLILAVLNSDIYIKTAFFNACNETFGLKNKVFNSETIYHDN